MKKQTNYHVTISGGIYQDMKINSDGSVTITMEMHEDTQPTIKTTTDITFVCIPVSSITRNDDLLAYVPNSTEEIEFKEMIEKVLSERILLEDFFIPEDYSKVKLFGDPIQALHYGSASCDTWIKNAEVNDCKILKISQYIMLLTWMLKVLIKNEGWESKKAWRSICTDSELLIDLDWEKVFGFKSFLTSAKKYLLPDDPSKDKGCFMASGGLNGRDWKYPLARIIKDSRRDCGKSDAPYLCYGFMAK